MKKLFLIVCSLALIFGMAGGAGAASYAFEDMIDYWNPDGTNYGPDQVLGEHYFDSVAIYESFSYQHDINDDVNFLAGDLVTSATLELDFTNDTTDDYGWLFVNYDFREFVRLAYDGSGWIEIGEQDNDQYAMVLDIDWLNDDGLLDVTIQVYNPLGAATAYLDHSRLYGVAETDDDPGINPIPEPGTMLLLGVGLLGLGLVRRKR